MNLPVFNIRKNAMQQARRIGAALGLVMAITPALAQNVEISAVAGSSASSTLDAKAVRASNRALAKAVRSALVKAKGIDLTKVFVYAKGGMVTLSGSVPESSQVARASEVAKAVPGVAALDNRLSVYALER
jgi:hyperosmotically inducible protein